jgi:hypothetical protein
MCYCKLYIAGALDIIYLRLALREPPKPTDRLGSLNYSIYYASPDSKYLYLTELVCNDYRIFMVKFVSCYA